MPYARRDQMTRQQLLGDRFGLDSVIAARYEVGRLIGRGGMAEVYSAFDRTLGRTVALKVLHEALAADHRAVARFRREARAVAALAHPNIVSIYDVGIDSQTPFLVMELIDGEPRGVLIPAALLLGQTPGHDRLDRRRDPRADRSQRTRGLLEMLIRDGNGRVAAERGVAGQHLVQHDAE